MRIKVMAAIAVALAASAGIADEIAGVPFGPRGGVGVNVLKLDRQRPATIYAATRTTGLFRSSDGGMSWSGVWTSPHATPQGNIVGVDPVVEDFLIDHHHPGRLFILAGGVGLLRSDDGETWARVDVPMSDAGGRPSFLDMDPLDPGVLLVGSVLDGLLLSVDEGATWVKIQSVNVASIAVDPMALRTVYAGVASGVGGIMRFTFDISSTAVRQETWGAVKRSAYK